MSIIRNILFATLICAFATPALAARGGGGGDKVDICHWDEDQGIFFVINVSVNAVRGHFDNHGDSYPAIYFWDDDGDGYGDPAGATDVCPNAGYVDDNTDCDDTNAAVNPGVEEIPYNGLDDDCAEGTPDDDLDYDGFGIAVDCDDLNAEVNPEAEEICEDGIDNDCDGMDDTCAGACPCFTANDIVAAYEDYQEWMGEYTYSYEYCYEYDDYWYGWDETYLYFGGDNYNYPVDYEYQYDYFWSYGYDYYYDYNYCGQDDYYYYYNWQTGERIYSSDYEYLYITSEEMEACQDLIMDTGALLGITCYSYNW